MRWFHNLRLARKLALAFSVLLALTAALGVYALRGVARVNAVSADVGGHWLPNVRQSLAMGKAVAEYRNGEALLVLATTGADMDGYEAEMNTHRDEVTQASSKLAAQLATKDDSAAYAEFRDAWAAYQETSKEVVTAGRKHEARVALAILGGKSQEQYDKIGAAVGRLVEGAGDGAKQQMALGTSTYDVTRRSVVAAIALCIVVGIVLAVAIARGIARPMRSIAIKMRQLADGDLDQRVEVRSRDELGELAASFQSIVAAQAEVAAAARRLAEGDVSVEVVPRSERDVLSHSFAEMQATMRTLVGEVTEVAAALKGGQLSRRGDAERFRGMYGEMMVGVNDMLSELGGPSATLTTLLGRVADRDLSVRMTGTYQGDFVQLQDSFNTALTHLDDTLAQVAASADQVSSAGGEIAAGSSSLAQGASQQAAALEEVSASLNELGATAKQNASNARQARGMAENARSGAAAGVASMQELSDAVNRIKQSADRTARIVKTIDEIAFQTNLLALNAAVEAARAGDAGRGFAVVADEVRALAQRSAQAARETGTLIEESVRAAEQGVTLNDAVLGRLRQINADVDSVGEVMAEIAAGSEQQDLGVSQINDGLGAMNTVTQQVAANAEQSSSASVELSSQAEGMRELVGTFHISAEGTTRGTGLAVPPRSAAVAPSPHPRGVVGTVSKGARGPKMPQSPADRTSPPVVPARASQGGVSGGAPALGTGVGRVPAEVWPTSGEALIPFGDDSALQEF